MKTKLLFFLFAFGISTAFSQINALKVLSKPAIDGELNESFWNITTPMLLNQGNSNNTANFGVLWDDNYLYIGVNVTDDIISINGNQGWHDDGVEVCLDGNYSHSTSFDSDDRQFVKAVKTHWFQEMNNNRNGVNCQYKLTSTGYSIEFAIPWSNFNTTVYAGKTIGFNVAVNDDDDTTVLFNAISSLRWTGNSTYYLNTSSWGTLTLSSQTTDYSGAFIALISPCAGDLLIKNKNTLIKWVSKNINSVKIEYSTNNGIQWNTLANNVPAINEMFLWSVNAMPSDSCKIRISDASNSSVTDLNENEFSISAPFSHVDPMIKSLWQNYQWPCNAYFPIDSNGVNGHVGNACGHSALTRIIHTWQFPVVGNDSLNYNDVGGHNWKANFGNTTYDYDKMPYNLLLNANQAEYHNVATLFYHAATSMHDIYGSGTDLNNMSYAMSHYFRYKTSIPVARKHYNKAEWTKIMKNELDSGRVLIIMGKSALPYSWHNGYSFDGHWYNCDGYNESGKFHIVVGFGNYSYDGYFDVDSFPIYSYNLGILCGLEPNLNGKSIQLTSLNNGEAIIANHNTNITWSSLNVNQIKIEYTIDNGQNWNVISTGINASLAQYNWITPNISSNQCKIRITDINDINVYDKSNQSFGVYPYQLNLLKPANNSYFVTGSKVQIKWDFTIVPLIKIELSTDNGNNWIIIDSNIQVNQASYLWTVPNLISNQCKIKISDMLNSQINSFNSLTFEIGNQNIVGGPYANDSNTIVLLHFDDDLLNQSAKTANATGLNYSFHQNTVFQLGVCVKPMQFLKIPHDNDLNLLNDWTIEAWIKINTFYTSYYSSIVLKPGDFNSYFSNYDLQINPSWNNVLYALYFSDSTRYGVTGLTPVLNQWLHIAFIRNTANSTIKMLIHDQNRQLINQYTQSFNPGIPLTNIQDLKIGSDFDGFIDEVRISNVVRNFSYVGFEMSNYNEEILLYPNPTDRYLTLKSINNDLKILNIQISDITGKLYKAKFSNDIIDLTEFSNGIYFIKITLNDKTTIVKKISKL